MRGARRSVPRLLFLAASVGLLLAALTGCDAAQRGYPVAVFRPESPEATAIRDLAIILLIIGGIAFVVVESWLLLAIFRFRNRPEEEAIQTHGNLKMESAWTLVTAVIIFAVLGATIKTMVDVAGTASAAAVPAAGAFPGDAVVMRVVGHQFWWTFEYPQQGLVTANEVHVPQNRTVKVQLEAEDVIHSFWAPRLMGKTDTIPGQINYTSFVPIQEGTYFGLCGEFCGAQHAHMGFRVVVDSPQAFSDWTRNQLAPAAQPTTDQQIAGGQAFQQSCAGCHSVRGTPAQGKRGPDLTHVGSRGAIAAELMENNPENLAIWLTDPQAAKHGNLMPKLVLDQQTIQKLVAYLTNLK